jgi:hypothetical protein
MSSFTLPDALPGITIALASNDDAGAIADMVRRLPSDLEDKTEAELEEWSEQMYGRDSVIEYLNTDSIVCLVVREAGRVVGYASLDLRNGNFGSIHTTYDNPDIGALLIETRITLARSAGLDPKGWRQPARPFRVDLGAAS